MSPWATDQKPLLKPSETSPVEVSDTAQSPPTNLAGPEIGESKTNPPVRRVMPWWVKVVPFFLSAFFFISAFFAIFSPLPLLFFQFRAGRKWTWLAILTNCLIIGVAAGAASLAVYLVTVITVTVALMECLNAKRSVERSATVALLMMVLISGLGLAGYAHTHHIHLLTSLQKEVSEFVDYLGTQISSSPEGAAVVAPGELDDWKKNVLTEFPSAVAIFALLLVWANLVALLRLNPNGLRERMGLDVRFARSWKAPQFLVWPTILTGAFLVYDAGPVSDVSLNVFKFLMAIYAIQGLSILSFFFDLWKVKGLFRALGFVIGIFLMMPLVLSLGFFDLWFDFRSKFRQS